MSDPVVATVTELTEAHQRGRKDYNEGVPGNLNPFLIPALAREWHRGWWSGFRDYPPNQRERQE